MSRKSNYTGAAEARKRRRRMTLLISAVSAAFVIGLLYYEQIALLYVLATLGVTVLLIAVALSDLGESRRAADAPAPFDDSAAIADGLTSAAAAATAPPRPAPAERAARNRRRR